MIDVVIVAFEPEHPSTEEVDTAMQLLEDRRGLLSLHEFQAVCVGLQSVGGQLGYLGPWFAQNERDIAKQLEISARALFERLAEWTHEEREALAVFASDFSYRLETDGPHALYMRAHWLCRAKGEQDQSPTASAAPGWN